MRKLRRLKIDIYPESYDNLEGIIGEEKSGFIRKEDEIYSPSKRKIKIRGLVDFDVLGRTVCAYNKSKIYILDKKLNPIKVNYVDGNIFYGGNDGNNFYFFVEVENGAYVIRINEDESVRSILYSRIELPTIEMLEDKIGIIANDGKGWRKIYLNKNSLLER